MTEPRPPRAAQLALVGLGVLALAAAVLDPSPLRRGAAVGLALFGIVGATVRAERRLSRELDALAAAAATTAAADVGRLRLLELQRDGLAEYLTRVDQRLREPVADARRARLAHLEGVSVSLAVGPDLTEATLVDLTLEQGVFALAPAVARRLVPGMPVAIAITVGEELVQPEGAVAIAPTHTDRAGAVDWVVRFARPLVRERVPAALWQAVAMRTAERVQPPASVPATATLLAPFGDVPAEVTDLSETGVGLLVSLDDTRLGDLDRALVVRLTFPTLGRMAVLSAELCNVSPSPPGVRLGLRFSQDERAELDWVTEWLAACASVDLDPEPSAISRQPSASKFTG